MFWFQVLENIGQLLHREGFEMYLQGGTILKGYLAYVPFGTHSASQLPSKADLGDLVGHLRQTLIVLFV